MPTIKANGIDIHYRERGQGTPLLLIMGLGADGPVWEDHVKAYEQHFRCILMDNRGSGLSSKPQGPYTTRMMADDGLGLMDALGIRRFHLSGISMGGAISQELAIGHSERLLSVTLNCSWVKCDNYGTRIFEMLRSMRAVADPVAFTRLLQLWIFTPAYHQHRMDDLISGEEAANSHPHPMPLHAFQAQCDACISHDTRGKLAKIAAPVLVTVGEKDIFTPVHFSQSVAEQIEKAEMIVFENSGHTHHWDSRERFNRTTLDFMLRHDRPV